MKTKTNNIQPQTKTDPGVIPSAGVFRFMIERMNEGAVILDKSGGISYANKSVCRLTGFSKDELTGNGIQAMIDPSEQAIFENIFPGSGYDGDNQVSTLLRSKTGERINVVLSWDPYPVKEGGDEIYYLSIKNISLEKKLADEVKEFRDNYNLLIENHGEGIGIVDKDENFLVVNPAAEQIFGVEPGGLLKRNLMDFIVPEYTSRILEESAKRSQMEKSSYELDIITPSGVVKNILVTATPEINIEGKQIGGFGVFRDITERKKTELRLIESEKKYRSLFEAAQDAVFLIRDNRFVDCNSATLRLFGCAKEDIIGQTPDVFSPEKQPDGQDSMERSRYKLMLALEGDSHPFEWRHKQLNGTEFDAEILLSRIDGDSDPMILAFVRDITKRKHTEEELRHSEQKYRDMTNSLPTTIFESDLNGNLIYANQTAMEWFGVTGAEMEKGFNVLQFIAPQHRQRASEKFTSIIQHNTISSGEYLALKRNGELFDVYISSRAIVRDGKSIGVRGNMVNITERKKAEEAALKLALIVESSDDAIISTNLDGTISSWNKGAETIFGYSANEVIGNPISLLSDERNLEEERMLLEKIRQCGHVKHYETKRRKKNGRKFEVSLTLSPICNLEGLVIGAAYIIRDITERVIAEKFRMAKETAEVLLKSEEKFSKAFHNSPIPICITTLYNPQIIDFNESFEAQTGFTKEELQDRHLLELRIFHDRQDLLVIIQGLTSKGYVRNKEVIVRIKNGDERTCLLSSEVFELGGEPCALTVFLDVTERRQAVQTLMESEQRFKLMIEQTLVGFIECDTNFMVTSWNPSAERIFGFSGKEAIGRHIGNLIVKEEEQPERNNLWRDILVSQGGISTTNTNVTKDGRVITCEWHDTAIVNQNGLVIGIVSLVADISERIEIEESLRNSREQLQHFAQHLQTVREEERVYISRELHDSLGQSLTGLKMYAFNVSNKLNSDLSSINLDSVRSQAKEVVGIIDGIMQQVRKIAKDLRPRILDEFGLIPAIEAHILEITKQTNIKYEVIKMIHAIEMDPAHSIEVFRIFQEACTNVIRHANATKITIRINLMKNNYYIEVEDNGCGIKETNISKLKSLGLLGMKERSLVFGGDLEITGVEGKGTKVRLSFPKNK